MLDNGHWAIYWIMDTGQWMDNEQQISFYTFRFRGHTFNTLFHHFIVQRSNKSIYFNFVSSSIYIYFACMWHVTPGKVYGCSELQKFVNTHFWFLLNFENAQKTSLNLRNFLLSFFLLYKEKIEPQLKVE